MSYPYACTHVSTHAHASSVHIFKHMSAGTCMCSYCTHGTCLYSICAHVRTNVSGFASISRPSQLLCFSRNNVLLPVSPSYAPISTKKPWCIFWKRLATTESCPHCDLQHTCNWLATGVQHKDGIVQDGMQCTRNVHAILPCPIHAECNRWLVAMSVYTCILMPVHMSEHRSILIASCVYT